MKRLEFFFDYGSPTAYLADTQLRDAKGPNGEAPIYVPMLLGGVFKATGNQPPGSIAAKGAYLGTDLPRFAKRYGVPLSFNPDFPINTLHLMRGAIWAQNKDKEEPGFFRHYTDSMFDAMWVNPRNLNDPAEVIATLKAADIDPQVWQEGCQQQQVKDKLRENTDEAVARGVFGAPTMFVGEEMFFGQDRLDFVFEAWRGEAA